MLYTAVLRTPHIILRPSSSSSLISLVSISRPSRALIVALITEFLVIRSTRFLGDLLFIICLSSLDKKLSCSSLSLTVSFASYVSYFGTLLDVRISVSRETDIEADSTPPPEVEIALAAFSPLAGCPSGAAVGFIQLKGSVPRAFFLLTYVYLLCKSAVVLRTRRAGIVKNYRPAVACGLTKFYVLSNTCFINLITKMACYLI